MADGIFGLADGMGGPGGGDVAAEIASTHAQSVVARGGDGHQAATAAHEAVRAGRGEVGPAGMGTTLCIAVPGWDGPSAAVQLTNVGDSRAYLLNSRREWQQLTRDQKYVQDLLDRGLISPDEAASHPQRSAITSAVGHDVFDPQVIVIAAEPSMRIVVCSDGVSDVIGDGALRALVSTRAAPDAVARQAIDQVVAAAGRDDATIVVADVIAVARRLPNLSQ